jgi:elongation factor 1-alpha
MNKKDSLIMSKIESNDTTVKIAIAGNVDSGKSTLAGALVNNCLDDGRGKCRNMILRNKHEIETGRTSCISFNNLVLDLEKRRKILSFIDLAGHEKYLNTTVSGLTGLFVDYGLVLVGSNMGITKMTKEHLGILLYLKIPIIVLMTKTDLCPENVYERTERSLRRILKLPLFGVRPYFFPKDQDKCMDEMGKFLDLRNPLETFIPIIPLSNKTGLNIDNLKKLLFTLEPKIHWKTDIDGSIMYIDSNFWVKGIGLVLSGTIRGNPIKLNQTLFLGPINNKFIEFRVRSMHNNVREHVSELVDGQVGCIAIKFIGKEDIPRKLIIKGVLVFDNKKFIKNVSRKFKAEIQILHHSTTIRNNYQPMLHCGPIRQAARINIIENQSMSSEKSEKSEKRLRTGGKAIVEFTFSFRSEFLEEGVSFFFRDGSTKGYGKILEVL